MDLYEYLQKDHDKVEMLFKQFHKSPDKRKPAIAALIVDELQAHLESEQRTFYKTLEKYSESKQEALHGWKEHEQIDKEIEAFDLENMKLHSLETRLKKLQQLVEHHVDEEEGPIFKRAKAVLSKDQSNTIKELMHDLKHQLLMKRR